MPAPAYVSGSTVNITVPLPVVGGSVPTINSITYTVNSDKRRGLLSDVAVQPPDPTTNPTSVSFQIDSTTNTITPWSPCNKPTRGPYIDQSGEYVQGGSTFFFDDATTTEQDREPTVRSTREVVTTFQTSAGEFVNNQLYIVQLQEPLMRMVNSFITWPETAIVRYEMPTLTGWDGATYDQQIAALYSAFRNMLQLRYRFPIGENFQSRIVDFYGMSVDNVFGRVYMVLADIGYYTQLDYQGWPVAFQQALKRGQMAEADYLLSGDPIATKRNLGVLSETIGESNMRFRMIPDVTMAVSRDCLDQLKGYLNSSTLVGRG